ncbi:LacI family DNA-binding transcriptional regulator [Rhizobium lusitanum]|uniref:LacI family DNA-binding transcriptional regulator n=1 Tax=Rhizobium lusitanum TaxID=293958 RepID=UPI001AEE5207|nr:LacI family DNA-binding transcriptional regulator [Rhizobium lusitanum]
MATVAEMAGVSEATVSRVLNRRYGIASATRQAVEDALRKSGYERSTRGNIVLILVPGLASFFFSDLCDAFAVELGRAGLNTIVGPVYPGTVQERDYVESLVHRGIAAVVFLSASNTLVNSDPVAHQLLHERGVPFVTFNGAFAGVEAPVFSTDDWRAAELAVGHLYDLGHRRIGICTGPEGNMPADRRLEGFLTAMRRRNIAGVEKLWVRQPYGTEGGRRGAEMLLAEGVTGIVAASDEMALGAIRHITREGLHVPSDISVVGYNDSRWLDFTDPPLTSVRQPVDDIVRSITSTLNDIIANRSYGVGEILLEPELRVRGSTAPVPPDR